MWIYKITNIQNNKIYIGQSIRPIQERFHRHISDAKNPMAKKIKRINIQDNSVEIFDTVISCAKACGIQNGKTSITERLSGKINSPFKGKWLFEYCNE